MILGLYLKTLAWNSESALSALFLHEYAVGIANTVLCVVDEQSNNGPNSGCLVVRLAGFTAFPSVVNARRININRLTLTMSFVSTGTGTTKRLSLSDTLEIYVLSIGDNSK